MTERTQGQPGADRAVGRPGPAARMESTQGGATTATAPRPDEVLELTTEQPASPARANGGRRGAGTSQGNGSTPSSGHNGATAPDGSSAHRPQVLIDPVASASAAPVSGPPTATGSARGLAGAAAPARASAAATASEQAKQATTGNQRSDTAPGKQAGKQSSSTGGGPAQRARHGGSGLKPASSKAAKRASKKPQQPPPLRAKPATTAAAGASTATRSAGFSVPSSPTAKVGTQAVAGVTAASAAVGSVARTAATRARRSQAGKLARTAVQGRPSPRSARLYLTHVDPWSVMKQAFLLSLALAAVTLTAFAVLWFALDSAGVLDAITRTATDVGGESGANVSSFLSFSKVMGVALIISGIEAVLVTALATLFSFLYNLAVAIGGGVELTLSEDA